MGAVGGAEEGAGRLGRLTAGDRDLLRGFALVPLPVPQTVAARLLAAQGCAEPAGPVLDRLLTAGALEAGVDPIDPRLPVVSLTATLRSAVESPSESEAQHIAHAVAAPLFVAWGGAEAAYRRPGAACEVLVALALRAGTAEAAGILAVVGAAAVRWRLEVVGLPSIAARLGIACLARLEAAGITPGFALLRWTGRACRLAADLGHAIACLFGSDDRPDAVRDPEGLALRHELALLLQSLGDHDRAERLMHENLAHYRALGDRCGLAGTQAALAACLQTHAAQDGAQGGPIEPDEDDPDADLLADLVAAAKALQAGRPPALDG